MRAPAWVPPLALSVVVPIPAYAHLVNSGLGPFYNGTVHLLLSPRDLLALLAVSLLAGQSGKASARWAAVALPLAWGVAALAGLTLGAVAELGWLKVTLLITLGVLVAVGARLSASVMASPAALIGLVHGLENGGAFAASGSDSVAVAGASVAVLSLMLLTAALAVSPAGRLDAHHTAGGR
jgi:urease accessory protein